MASSDIPETVEIEQLKAEEEREAEVAPELGLREPLPYEMVEGQRVPQGAGAGGAAVGGVSNRAPEEGMKEAAGARALEAGSAEEAAQGGVMRQQL